MLKNRRKSRLCVQIILIVILLSFLKYRVSAEQPMTQPLILNTDGTRLYSDSEIDLLIEDISEIAEEAIEKAAADAAKAVAVAAVEREALILQELEQTRQVNRRKTLIAVLAGVLGGFVIGFAVNR